MLKNKIIFELFNHLHSGSRKNYRKAELIISQIFKILQQDNKLVSPVHVIETALFNILIPVCRHNNIQVKLVGNFLKQSIIRGLLSIIKYAKYRSKNQTMAIKLAAIFNSLYKKDHILYEQKIIYINKLLNI